MPDGRPRLGDVRRHPSCVAVRHQTARPGGLRGPQQTDLFSSHPLGWEAAAAQHRNNGVAGWNAVAT